MEEDFMLATCQNGCRQQCFACILWAPALYNSTTHCFFGENSVIMLSTTACQLVKHRLRSHIKR